MIYFVIFVSLIGAMSKTIKWGIIGLGSIAHKFASDLLLADNAVLNGVASRSENKAKEFAQSYQADKYFSDYEALAQDEMIDIIYVATPNTYHFEHTLLCFKHNKSVLCEKPMGVNSTEVKTMIREARSRDLFLMEGIWTRFIPAIQKLLELINANKIGNIISVDANFGFKKEFDAESRLFNKQLGGGSLLDIGIYPIYISFLALGFPADIKAMARMTNTQVDLSCMMLFHYENDSIAQLSSTFEANTTNEAFIYGTKGKIKIHAPFHHPQQISLYDHDGQQKDFQIPYRGNGYVHEIESVNQCLQHGLNENPRLSLENSLLVTQIIDVVKKQIGLSYSR